MGPWRRWLGRERPAPNLEQSLAAAATAFDLRPLHPVHGPLLGTSQGFGVELAFDGGLRVSIQGGGRIPEDVIIGPRGGWSEEGVPLEPGLPAVRPWLERHFLTDALAVFGDEQSAHALFTPEVIPALQVLVEQGAHLSHGTVEWRARGPAPAPAALVDLCRRLLDAAEALALAKDQLPARLRSQSGRAASPRLRWQCLELLLRHHPAHPETDQALSMAVHDPDGHVRLLAAAALGPAGVSVLTDLALGTGWAQSARITALQALARHAPGESLPVLLQALAAGAEPVHTAALEAVLGLDRTAVPPSRLVELVQQDPRFTPANAPPRLAAALGRVLGRTLERAAETPLLALLARPEVEVKREAALALAWVGGRDAVLPLLEEARRPFLDGELKQALRQAVQEIQRRLVAAPGALALAQGEQGQLALSGEPGALSLDDEP